MNRDELLAALSALDFMAVDLHLYMDTHPEDDTALMMYNEIVTKANELRIEFEKLHGPLYSYRSLNCNDWRWDDDPWPWQICHNFQLPKEVRK